MDKPPDDNELIKTREPVFGFPDIAEDSLPEWFRKNRLAIAKGFCSFPDIRFGRLMAISMLSEAWDAPTFLEENRGSNEVDRMFTIAYIQFLASQAGILSYNEIKAIQEGTPVPKMIAPHFPTFEEVALKARQLKAQGKKIGLFGGSFDPFTITHASLQLMARNYCDFLIIGFDNDEHIRIRKGEIREKQGDKAPRYDVRNRRMFAEGLAVTEATVELHPVRVSEQAYRKDYRDLGIDILFVGESDHPALARMEVTMEKLGGEVKVLMGDQFLHATEIMRRVRESKDVPYDINISEAATAIHSTDLLNFVRANRMFNIILGEQ